MCPIGGDNYIKWGAAGELFYALSDNSFELSLVRLSKQDDVGIKDCASGSHTGQPHSNFQR